jgi:hypothetical protein
MQLPSSTSIYSLLRVVNKAAFWHIGGTFTRPELGYYALAALLI